MKQKKWGRPGRKKAYATKHVSFGNSLETSNVKSGEEVETEMYKQKDIELSGEDTDCDLPDKKRCQEICRMLNTYSSN